jgi:hypothetical protein
MSSTPQLKEEKKIGSKSYIAQMAKVRTIQQNNLVQTFTHQTHISF